MEGAHFLASGTLVKLSEQQCVDCVTEDKGCNGGWQEDCFLYAEQNGMNTEEQYPYFDNADACLVSEYGKVKVLNYTYVP